MMKSYARILDLREVSSGKRTIIVGDIHGYFYEFMKLLEKCEYSEGDIVVATGDLVDRGPQADRVLSWFTSVPNTYVVKGNHDDKAARFWLGNKVKLTNGLQLTISQCHHLDTRLLANWIDSLPHIIRLANFQNKPMYVVHAGIDGRYSVEQQRDVTCLYARYLDGKNYFDKNGTIWWDTLDGSYYVACGHISSTIYHPTDYVYCLDGGLCHGEKLRAMILENDTARIVEIVGEKIQIMSQNSITERDQLVDRGLLRSDDLENLRVYTYTDACTFSGQWDEITRHSRGHIFNVTTGECVACTFPKFFNLNEKLETQENILPWSSGYTVFEKLDGWLGNLYRFNGEFRIATRGSFSSPGADWANGFLKQHFDLSDLPDELTLVFELICPVTKIIVDYGLEEKLVLLTIFNRHTGEEYPWNFVVEVARKYGFEVPKIYGSDIEECKRFLASANGRNMEGFVIRFANGQRIKIKAEDYVRRAKIKSRLTPLGVWEIMVNGRVPESCRQLLDVEYHEYLDSIADILEQRYVDVKMEIYDEFSSIDNDLPRKDFAQAIKSKIHKPIMFACLDSRSELINKYIMEKIRPHNNRM